MSEDLFYTICHIYLLLFVSFLISDVCLNSLQLTLNRSSSLKQLKTGCNECKLSLSVNCLGLLYLPWVSTLFLPSNIPYANSVASVQSWCSLIWELSTGYWQVSVTIFYKVADSVAPRSNCVDVLADLKLYCWHLVYYQTWGRFKYVAIWQIHLEHMVQLFTCSLYWWRKHNHR